MYLRVAAVEGVEVELAVPVGREVDGVADPHRVALGAHVRGDLVALVGREVEGVEVLRPAAFVALPVAEVAEERRIDHLLAVRREVAGAGVGHRQLLGRPPAAGTRKRLGSPRS